MRRIYEGDLFKIYFTQIVKTRDLYMGATYNWMRPIYAKIRYTSFSQSNNADLVVNLI